MYCTLYLWISFHSQLLSWHGTNSRKYSETCIWAASKTMNSLKGTTDYDWLFLWSPLGSSSWWHAGHTISLARNCPLMKEWKPQGLELWALEVKSVWASGGCSCQWIFTDAKEETMLSSDIWHLKLTRETKPWLGENTVYFVFKGRSRARIFTNAGLVPCSCITQPKKVGMLYK